MLMSRSRTTAEVLFSVSPTFNCASNPIRKTRALLTTAPLVKSFCIDPQTFLGPSIRCCTDPLKKLAIASFTDSDQAEEEPSLLVPAVDESSLLACALPWLLVCSACLPDSVVPWPDAAVVVKLCCSGVSRLNFSSSSLRSNMLLVSIPAAFSALFMSLIGIFFLGSDSAAQTHSLLLCELCTDVGLRRDIFRTAEFPSSCWGATAMPRVREEGVDGVSPFHIGAVREARRALVAILYKTSEQTSVCSAQWYLLAIDLCE
mmetsp:Transcript_32296/g.54213  ORF Transcript_32296/g.54213 Transcript_32296/m.54213 type:complete len:260 (-) Transcript_32296:48-827(-)